MATSRRPLDSTGAAVRARQRPTRYCRCGVHIQTAPNCHSPSTRRTCEQPAVALQHHNVHADQGSRVQLQLDRRLVALFQRCLHFNNASVAATALPALRRRKRGNAAPPVDKKRRSVRRLQSRHDSDSKAVLPPAHASEQPDAARDEPHVTLENRGVMLWTAAMGGLSRAVNNCHNFGVPHLQERRTIRSGEQPKLRPHPPNLVRPATVQAQAGDVDVLHCSGCWQHNTQLWVEGWPAENNVDRAESARISRKNMHRNHAWRSIRTACNNGGVWECCHPASESTSCAILTGIGAESSSLVCCAHAFHRSHFEVTPRRIMLMAILCLSTSPCSPEARIPQLPLWNPRSESRIAADRRSAVATFVA